MPFLTMRHDFRTPADGSSTPADIYRAAMDQFRWADAHGFDFAVVSEHHGFGDGWMPAPLIAAAAIVGATERIPLLLSAVLLPLHDPIRIAEQLVVLGHDREVEAVPIGPTKLVHRGAVDLGLGRRPVRGGAEVVTHGEERHGYLFRWGPTSAPKAAI